ncbi:MAG: TIGR04084 family radical SAM/SPASM domain-containing protein [Nanobdellota archaeon]
MNYNIFTTMNCNLKCKYCADNKVRRRFPFFPSYNLEDLKSFLEKDAECNITFYGGEPLINKNQIKKIMDCVHAKKFMLQTNGILLKEIKRNYINRLHTILISIDGDEILTDYYRGIGTYKSVINNAKQIKQNGFEGELIARMTIDEKTDIHKQVNHLLRVGIFDSIHWQLNMCFFDKETWKNPEKWVYEKYNPGIRKLVDEWLEKIERGNVKKIYPFIGVMQNIIKEQNTLLRCGAGRNFFNILTDGSIAPCTNLRDKDFILGTIFQKTPFELENSLFVKTPCTSCSYYGLCGGRCLVANLTKPWGEEGFNLVCETVKNLIDKLIEIKPKIQDMIEKGVVSIDDFEYTKYNGCEIIP